MIEVKEVKTSKQQKEFLNFALDLYKGNPYFVPPLYMDEKKMFRKDYVYNSSCDWTCFVAYKDGKPAGRIQCIIQKDANAKNGEKRCRFCRFDTVDDPEVSKALFQAAEAWAREKGCSEFASDCELINIENQGFHRAVGFTEANRHVAYVRKL